MLCMHTNTSSNCQTLRWPTFTEGSGPYMVVVVVMILARLRCHPHEVPLCEVSLAFVGLVHRLVRVDKQWERNSSAFVCLI